MQGKGEEVSISSTVKHKLRNASGSGLNVSTPVGSQDVIVEVYAVEPQQNARTLSVTLDRQDLIDLLDQLENG